jgi:pyruvate formate lyase activating enzyme
VFSWSDITDLLCDRIGLLDAVVFSGGEPTMQRGLLPALQVVRALGFKVAIRG